MAAWGASSWDAKDVKEEPKWESKADSWSAADTNGTAKADEAWAAKADSWPAADTKDKANADDAWAAKADAWTAADTNGTAKADDAWAVKADSWSAAETNETTKAGDSWTAAATNGTETAAEPWGASNGWGDKAADSYGDANGWDQGAKKPDGKGFWEAQQWNIQSGVLSKKEDWEVDQDDTLLFKERLGSSAGLDFNKYDSVPVDISGSKAALIPVVQTFEELYQEFKECIPQELSNNVRRCQYSKPTPVQKYAIPVGLVGRDVMCCAQTGSGKTAAYLMPIIGRMMKIHANPTGGLAEPFEGKCCPDTLVLSPTRELAIQIYEEALKFCHRTTYRVCRIYGGEKPAIQLPEISKGCDLMVATPGRLQDFIERGVVGVDKVFVLVLDEADRMLDMGFEPQVRDIVCNNGMPDKEGRQTMMFSATFAEECQKMAQDFLYDYIWIGVGVVGGAVDTVEQTLEQVEPKDKYTKLVEVLDQWFASREKEERCLIFVNAKDTAKWLDEQLYAKHIDTGALHGNLDQQEREKNLRRFRDGEIDVMVATDVAARGLDIEKVTVVVNYDMPTNIDSYVHRIGRTGRIGNKGRAVTFIAVDEKGMTCENLDELKQLLRIMQDAKCAIPDWLSGLIESGASFGADKHSYGKWGGKDMRGAWDDWEEKKEKTDGW